MRADEIMLVLEGEASVSPVSAEFLESMQALDVKWGMTAFYDQRQPIVEQYGLS